MKVIMVFLLKEMLKQCTPNHLQLKLQRRTKKVGENVETQQNVLEKN